MKNEIVQELNIDRVVVLNWLCSAGLVKKLDKWMPHELSITNLIDPISPYNELQKKLKNKQVLKRVVTGDEKCITYDSVQ